jgi:E3 ubiquitin-protein ligase UBR4
MQLVPYLMFFALYISLSTRSFTREEKNLTTFLNQPVGEKWLESAYEVDGPVYQMVLSIVLHSPETWAQNRVKFLKRVLTAYHVRRLYPSSTCKALNSTGDKEVKDFSVYKPALMIYALVDLINKYYFGKVVNPKDEEWPVSIFNYIRRNDEAMMKSATSTLDTFRDEFLPCASFAEFCDVAGEFFKNLNYDLILNLIVLLCLFKNRTIW